MYRSSVSLIRLCVGRRCLLASSSTLHLLDTELHPLLPGPTDCQRSQEASREMAMVAMSGPTLPFEDGSGHLGWCSL